MIEADEGGVGDEVVGLFAAIVGMGAPGDVGEQAGGVAQPRLLGVSSRWVEPRNCARPGEQLLAVAGRARAQAG